MSNKIYLIIAGVIIFIGWLFISYNSEVIVQGIPLNIGVR